MNADSPSANAHSVQCLYLLTGMSMCLESAVQPLLVKAVFDGAVVQKSLSRFAFLALAYLVFGLLVVGLQYLLLRFRRSLEARLIDQLEGAAVGAALRLESREFDQHSSAYYVSRVHHDVMDGVLPQLDVRIRMVRALCTGITLTVVLVYLSWVAAVLSLILVLPLALLSSWLARKVRSGVDRERVIEGEWVGLLGRAMLAFHNMLGLHHHLERTVQSLDVKRAEFVSVRRQNHQIADRQATSSDAIMNVCDALSIFVGGSMVIAGRLTAGGFFAFINAFWRAVGGFVTAVNLLPEMAKTSAIAARVETFMRSAPAALDAENDARSTELGPRTAVAGLDAVRVRLGERELALPTIVIGQGERVLVRGGNGVGKTTMIHLLSGRMHADQGEVVLPADVVSLVSPMNLPPLPVRELVPDRELRRRLDLEGLLDRDAEALSAGQRQRVGLGALLCHRSADLVLIDEPTANLDDTWGTSILDLLLTSFQPSTAVVVILHEHQEWDVLFDRVVEVGSGATPS